MTSCTALGEGFSIPSDRRFCVDGNRVVFPVDLEFGREDFEVTVTGRFLEEPILVLSAEDVANEWLMLLQLRVLSQAALGLRHGEDRTHGLLMSVQRPRAADRPMTKEALVARDVIRQVLSDVRLGCLAEAGRDQPAGSE